MKLLEIVDMMGIKEPQQVWSIGIFDKKTGSGLIATRKTEKSVDEELGEQLRKPVIKKSKRRKVCTRFKDNIWAEDLAKWSHCLLRIKMLNIHYVSQMFSLNMEKVKKIIKIIKTK